MQPSAKLVFPALYGIYLSLGILGLQPFHNLGLSPFGAMCLFVFGSGLANFISSAGSLQGALSVPSAFLRRVFFTSAVQAVGAGSFLGGVLTGSGYLFAMMALLYGIVAGMSWSRFVRSRGFSSAGRWAVVLASLVMCVFILWEISFRDEGLWMGVLDSHVRISRALALTGAIFWGVGHYSFNPTEFFVSRSQWNLWESLFSVAIVFSAGIVLKRFQVGSTDLLNAGFQHEPLLIVPFLVFGIIYGALRARLVLAWESRLTSRAVQLAWVVGAVVCSILCSWYFLRNGSRLPEGMGLVLVGLSLYLMRQEPIAVADYHGLRQVRLPHAP